MTRTEWENELKNHIRTLPHSEQEKALDYYRELYYDKLDIGVREERIIAEFGNPKDVAEKIMSEYRDEKEEDVSDRDKTGKQEKIKDERSELLDDVFKTEKEKKTFTAERPQYAAEKRHRSTFSKVMLVFTTILFGGATLMLTIALWGVVIATFICGAAFIGGGIFGFIMSMTVIASSTAVALVWAGGCVFLCGIGVLIFAFSKKICKGIAGASKGLYTISVGWYFRKKERYGV